MQNCCLRNTENTLILKKKYFWWNRDFRILSWTRHFKRTAFIWNRNLLEHYKSLIKKSLEAFLASSTKIDGRLNLLFEPLMPSLSSGLPLVTPPNALSTMKAVILSFFWPSLSTTSVLANTVMMSAQPPLEIQNLRANNNQNDPMKRFQKAKHNDLIEAVTFVPLSKKCLPSSVSVARVCIDAASLPLTCEKTCH